MAQITRPLRLDDHHLFQMGIPAPARLSVGDNMSKLFLALVLFAASGSMASAQEAPLLRSQNSRTSSLAAAKPGDIEAKAAVSRKRGEKLQRRIDVTAKQAVNSMCVECAGSRYNQPGSKTPFILSDELSAMVGNPQLEKEP